MSTQIHLGIVFKTGRVFSDEDYRKLAFDNVKTKLGGSLVERNLDEGLFETDFKAWEKAHWDDIADFISVSSVSTEYDIGADLRDTKFYKYISKEDHHLWIGLRGVWLNSDMNDMASAIGIPYCSNRKISDETLAKVAKVFNYFNTPEAWNKAAEKMLFEDNELFDRLVDVAPCNFWSRFRKKAVPKEEVEDSGEDKGCVEEDDVPAEDDEEEDEDFTKCGIESFLQMYSFYRQQCKFDGYDMDGREVDDHDVAMMASYM